MTCILNIKGFYLYCYLCTSFLNPTSCIKCCFILYFISVDLRSYRWLRAMIFTVDEINRDPVLLPNVTLGYLVADTCLAESTTLSAALALVTGEENTVLSTECNGAPMVPVIIGDARSSASVVVADTLGVFDIPMVC